MAKSSTTIAAITASVAVPLRVVLLWLPLDLPVLFPFAEDELRALPDDRDADELREEVVFFAPLPADDVFFFVDVFVEPERDDVPRPAVLRLFPDCDAIRSS